jgi:hypothetical protein
MWAIATRMPLYPCHGPFERVLAVCCNVQVLTSSHAPREINTPRRSITRSSTDGIPSRSARSSHLFPLCPQQVQIDIATRPGRSAVHRTDRHAVRQGGETIENITTFGSCPPYWEKTAFAALPLWEISRQPIVSPMSEGLQEEHQERLGRAEEWGLRAMVESDRRL